MFVAHSVKWLHNILLRIVINRTKLSMNNFEFHVFGLFYYFGTGLDCHIVAHDFAVAMKSTSQRTFIY